MRFFFRNYGLCTNSQLYKQPEKPLKYSDKYTKWCVTNGINPHSERPDIVPGTYIRSPKSNLAKEPEIQKVARDLKYRYHQEEHAPDPQQCYEADKLVEMFHDYVYVAGSGDRNRRSFGSFLHRQGVPVQGRHSLYGMIVPINEGTEFLGIGFTDYQYAGIALWVPDNGISQGQRMIWSKEVLFGDSRTFYKKLQRECGNKLPKLEVTERV